MKRVLLGLALMVLLAGCYHATVTTGARPGDVKIEQKWAKGWILGLVPPSTVETMGKCSNGVAQVDTQLSFLNQLVSGITLGIFTPMEIVVTCAEGENNSLPLATNPDEARRLLESGVSFLIPW
jgi:hypothetical protein